MHNKKYKPYRNTLRNVFVGYAMTPIIIFTAITFFIIFVLGYKSVEKRNRDNNALLQKRLEANLLSYSETIREYSSSPTIIDAIKSENKRHKAYEVVYDFINAQDIKCNFYFFDSLGNMVMSNTNSPPEYIQDSNKLNWGVFKRMRINPGEVSASINRVYSPLNKYSIFTIGKAVLADEAIQGFIIFELLENDVLSIVTSFNGNDTVITDKYFNVASASNNNYTDNLTRLKNEYRITTGKTTVNGEKYYVCRSELFEGNFFVYTFTTLDYYEKTFLLGGIFLAILFTAITFAMIVISKRISLKKTEVIDDLLKAIYSVQNGNLDTVLKIDTNDEFQIIAESYNKMLIDIKKLIEQNNEETKRSMMAEIKQLESQFDPHFLFNTLETIRCMVRLYPNEVERIIVNLSSLLRYSINNTINRVTLGEDIKYTENYLEILKFRFKKRFNYEINLEEETLDCIVPKLLVQPIIENAVKHGFEGKDNLTVKIKARFLADQLIIVIFDDGAGIPKEKVEQVKNLLDEDCNSSICIGLHNVNRRIQLMYGKEYGLDILSEENAGTTVRICIPADW